MGKYGRVNMGAPDFTDEINALKDLLEKGEITQEEFNKKKEYFRKLRLNYIVVTNGGHTPSRKQMKQWNGRLTELKDRHLAAKMLEYRERLLQETGETVEESGNTETPPS